MDAQTIVDRNISRLLRMYAFWGNLVMTFDVQESEEVTQTMATDGVQLWYNPTYVVNQKETILCTDLAHEAGHKMYFDHLRRGHRDPKLWNRATDFRINYVLKMSGFELDDTFLYDQRFHDWNWDAEQIYDFLEQNPDDQANKQAEEKGGCGCGGLKDHPSQQPKQGSQGEDGDQPSGATSIETVNFGEAEILMEIAQAMNFAKSQGQMPAGLEADIKEILDPKIRWEQRLQEFMEQCNQDDYDWTQRDRRLMHLNMYFPSLASEGIDTFVVAIDTSGSMYPYISQVLAEVSKISSVLKFNKLIVIFCDSEIAHVDQYEKHDLPIRAAKTYGGGGTDFRPPFDWLVEHDIHPKGMVYLTDTYGPFPEAPDYPVLWTVPAGSEDRVPFGQTVTIE